LSGLDIVTMSSASAQAGDYYAWLGGYNDAVDVIYQEVAVPADGGVIDVSGYYRISNQSGVDSGDVASLEIVNTSGAVLETLQTWTGDPAVTTWTTFSVQSSSSYGGQTVRVQMRATTNANKINSFRFDTLSATVQSCD
jgi:hypothetical protein